ncbi:MAG TPA: glycerol-3-phosphate 1-O-acyltransferase [Deltaproteobacteria bacterium]|nr:glycerol-3-phosphate 1-O-acyltransferase [Deltaproteobacteria bacterium]
MLSILVFMAFAYIVGSIPSGVVVARLLGAPDPREVGSGNIGATNVSRAAGKGAGLATLAADLSKGALPTCIAMHATGGRPLAVTLTGLAAMAGHLYPLFLRFKGGKGVATAAGVVAVISPSVLLFDVAVFVVVAALTRYVSLASLAAAAALPGFFLVTAGKLPYVPFGVAAAAAVAARHSANIKRLLEGRENRL